MKQVRALIVEDNPFMATVLHDMLLQHASDIAAVDVVHTGHEALALIAASKPNVVFLDIELPDMTGFELLQQVGDISFKTVFTTSHSHYAIKAFRFNALDYLVKPINESELKEAIQRIGTLKESAITAISIYQMAPGSCPLKIWPTLKTSCWIKVSSGAIVPTWSTSII